MQQSLPTPASSSFPTPLRPGLPSGARDQSAWRAGRRWTDWAFALLVLAFVAYAFVRVNATMDFYDKAILLGFAPAFIALTAYGLSFAITRYPYGAESCPNCNRSR